MRVYRSASSIDAPVEEFPLIPRLRVLGPEHGKFCIVLLNTQCEEVPMKLGATSISFGPKVFSDYSRPKIND